MFAGCTVALVTPFKGGEVDFEALAASVDWHLLAQGTPVLSPVGDDGRVAHAQPRGSMSASSPP